MTRQEAYDIVRKHLLTQMQRSFAPTAPKCRYRNAEGLRCAIRALIPDEKYDPHMDEGGGLSLVIDRCGLSELGTGFLHALQTIHDLHEPEAWASELDGFAKRWNLV